LRTPWSDNICRGDSPQETSPAVTQMQIGSIACHGDKHISECFRYADAVAHKSIGRFREWLESQDWLKN
jgi:hypothetical protein